MAEMRGTEMVQPLTQELRRGTVVLSVLSQLSKPKYGYALVQTLEQRGLAVEANTLYPLLRRLEKQKLLKSEWETTGNKPRKYYSLTQEGAATYAQLRRQWEQMVEGMRRLMEDGGENDDQDG